MAFDELANDQPARERFLAFARDADEPPLRARMIKLAHKLGWLSADGERDELVRLAQDLLAGGRIGSADVDLVCSLNRDHALDPELRRIRLSPGVADNVTQAVILACLGSVDGRARVLEALTGANNEEVQIAQVYLQHRPIGDVGELRSVATRIARMADPDAQVRALNTLAGQYLSDRESLDELMRLFPNARSVSVKRAIAGIVMRAEYKAIDKDKASAWLR